MASLGPRFLTLGVKCTKSQLLTAALPSCTQVAKLRSVNDPFPLPPRPKPFRGRKYNAFWQMFDSPIPRMNENSIVVLVEGSLGTGKKELAKKLAEEFDLLYIDDIDFNSMYMSPVFEDFNYRDLNQYAVDRPMYVGLDEFWATEKLEDNPMIMRSQFDSFHLRWFKYRNALKHIFNTGQGVIMARSVYSDIAFCHAMVNRNLFKKSVYKKYLEYTNKAFKYLFTPHLVIYLDATPAYSMKKIKERNVPHEVNSPILTEDFLSKISEGYDKKILPKLEPLSEIMVLDADNLPDYDLLVEEMEKIDFNPFRDTLLRDEKFADWRLTHERQWASYRIWCDLDPSHFWTCNDPQGHVEIRDIQLTVEEFTTCRDYRVRKEQYYYDKRFAHGKDGMKGAIKRLFHI